MKTAFQNFVKRRVLFRIALVLACSVGFVVLLQLYSETNRGYVGGGFKRNFIPAPLTSFKSVDLVYNSFYIAGLTKDKIYLGSQTAPLKLKIYDWALQTETVDEIRLDPNESLPRSSFRLQVDSVNFFAMDGQLPRIYKGKTWSPIANRISDIKLYFKDAVPIGDQSFVLKSESATTHVDILIKSTGKSITVDTTILERQIDGVFCTDGMLHYSQASASLVYVYYYRNQYILADTNFSKIQRFRTIDTTSRAKLKIAEVSSDGIKTLAAPPVVVNRKSFVSGNWLFIQSGLMADNEPPEDLKYNGVIDVYDLANHQYKFSFYLPFERDNPLTSFSVTGNRIVAIYGRYLFAYEIRQSAFGN